MAWETISIKNLCDVKGGKRLPKGEKFSLIKTDYPYIRVDDFENNGINLNTIKYIAKNTHDKIKKYTLSTKDVFISIAGTIGLVGTIPKILDGCNLTENAAKLIIKDENKLLRDFIPLIFSMNYVRIQFTSFIGAVSVPKLALFRIEKCDIALPSLKEQQTIVSIITNLDNLISFYTNTIQTTKKLKTGLMQQLLTKGIGHKKFKKVKTLFGICEEIPEEWEVKTLEKLFEFLKTGTNSRKDLTKNGEIHYIHYGDIHTQWNKFVLDCNKEEIPQIEKNKVEQLSLLKEGDLIIADVSEDYEGSGASVLLKNIKNKKIVSGLHTFALRTDDKQIAIDFRTHITLGKFIKRQIISYVTGTSVYGLSKNNLKKITICLPKIKEQEKIGSILSNVDETINDLELKKTTIQNLKKGLMQKLLTGQLRVTA